MRRRKLMGWGLVLLLLILPALIAPSSTYDPTPLLASLAASVHPASPGPLRGPGSLIVRSVRLPGSTRLCSLRIEQGRIVYVGDAPGTDLPQLDGGGHYVMPGLFDAHVHVSLAPGAALRGDDAATSARLRAWHLRAYLAAGVTSILDPAIDERVARDVSAQRLAGHVGPRFYTLGTPVTARDGYVEDLFPPGFVDADRERLGRHLDGLVALGAVGVKVPLEPGVLAPIWNVHSPQLLAEIQQQAAPRKLPLYVHAMSEAMYERALPMAPHAFVHAPPSVSDATLRRLLDTHAYVMSTLSIYDVQRRLLSPEAFDDPLGLLTIPPIERQTLHSPAMQRRYLIDMVGENLPFVRGRYRDLLGVLGTTGPGQAIMQWALRLRLDQTIHTVSRLHRAGVPIVLGSDSGNWPVFPFFFHGRTTWNEVALLEQAGLTPSQTLHAATLGPAQMLGIEGEQGTVAVGQRADLLLVAADPLQGVSLALRSLQVVIFDGIAHTQQQWMQLP